MIPSSFPEKPEIARLTARMLLEIEAVHFRPADPFTLASGLPSPTYIDCRKLISFPRIRSTLMDFLSVEVMRNAGFEAFDNIAGGETAGIPFAALVAERLGLPRDAARYLEVVAVNRGEEPREVDVRSLDVTLSDGSVLSGRPLAASSSRAASQRHMLAAYGDVDGAIHKGEEPDYESVSDRLDEDMQKLKDAISTAESSETSEPS